MSESVASSLQTYYEIKSIPWNFGGIEFVLEALTQFNRLYDCCADVHNEEKLSMEMLKKEKTLSLFFLEGFSFGCW